MSASFEFTAQDAGGRIALVEKRLLGSRRVLVDQWNAVPLAPSVALRYLQRLIDDETARADGDSLWIPTLALLDMPSTVATQIGLPAVASLSLRLSLTDRIETPQGQIRLAWSDRNLRTVTPARAGMFLTVGHDRMRLSGSLFELVEAAEAYNLTLGSSADVRISAWAPVQSHLERLAGGTVTPDQILKSFRIYQAGGNYPGPCHGRETLNP